MNYDTTQVLTWIMTTVGLTGFLFAGKKLWWAWYINLACQILWAVYALVTGQPAFLASAVVFSVIFAVNAYKWTKDHLAVKKLVKNLWNSDVGSAHIMPNGVEITKLADGPVEEYPYELIARTCHEANRVLQLTNGEEDVSLTWNLAPEWQKESAIEGVKVALGGATAEELHSAWCRKKYEDGWVYGEFKDPEAKLHPCLVPYEKLPEPQRVKDYVFRAIVKSFKIHKQYAHIS
ncbi:hypothetical protein PBI_INGRID_71 [Arthrobacter phage Ingrid]|nr:hypothetical protein PBI_INGRID_71 [Arthrobacter phage Ingrid]QFG11050.1 hypothetical protein PBI_LORETTA_68 [Arthrobacter phage Loretta]